MTDFLAERCRSLLDRMNLKEKVQQLVGIRRMQSPANLRLGIPAFKCTDGPRGVGDQFQNATAFPVSIALAASWDPDLAFQVGKAIAREAKAKGRNWLLAPCINIVRDPRWGRAQESYGEDPYLTSCMAVPFVRAVQEQDVISCPKHLACNNQENLRREIDVRVEERALREIYLPAFQKCIQEGGAWSIMSAYNSVNGAFCCENAHLLTEILRQEWDFQGVVVSDWKSCQDTRRSLLAGLDVEMPKPIHYGRALLKAVKRGDVSEELVARSVSRVLRVKLQAGLFNGIPSFDPEVVNCEAHRVLALEVALSGTVLLKNEQQVLPLRRARLRSIAVIGPNAAIAQLGDHGSSEVVPFHSISPLQGIRETAGNNIQIHHEQGCGIESLDSDRESLEQALRLASECDVVVLVVGLDVTVEGEAFDRKDNTLQLPGRQAELIQSVAAANENIIVVVVGGSAVAMSDWLDHVPAVLHVWYPGEQGGLAIADLLFGNRNPSGKLPITFPEREDQLPAFPHFPDKKHSHYKEGIFVGYRYFDQRGRVPLFPFGHGLSYTKFQYDHLQVQLVGAREALRIEVRFSVTNTGSYAGAEVAQLYLRDAESRLERPPQELKAFQKVFLEIGQSRELHFSLAHEDLCYYDPDVRKWLAEPGLFEVRIGSSSRDIRLCQEFEVSVL
ncbi:MAG: glycoside hydrolase family 3 C-terminal domain-containing protein [Planctomycetota bacterium]